MERIPIAPGAAAPLPAAPGAEEEPPWVLFEAALGGTAGQQRGGAIAEILIKARRDGAFACLMFVVFPSGDVNPCAARFSPDPSPSRCSPFPAQFDDPSAVEEVLVFRADSRLAALACVRGRPRTSSASSLLSLSASAEGPLRPHLGAADAPPTAAAAPGAAVRTARPRTAGPDLGGRAPAAHHAQQLLLQQQGQSPGWATASHEAEVWTAPAAQAKAQQRALPGEERGPLRERGQQGLPTTPTAASLGLAPYRSVVNRFPAVGGAPAQQQQPPQSQQQQPRLAPNMPPPAAVAKLLAAALAAAGQGATAAAATSQGSGIGASAAAAAAAAAEAGRRLPAGPLSHEQVRE